VSTRRLNAFAIGLDVTEAGLEGGGADSLNAPPEAYGLTFMGADDVRAGAGDWTKKLVAGGSRRGRAAGLEDTVGSETSDSSLRTPPAAYGLAFAGIVLVRVTLKRRPPSPGGGQPASGSVGEVLELAVEVGRGASEEKLGGLFMMEMVSLRGMRRGAEL